MSQPSVMVPGLLQTPGMMGMSHMPKLSPQCVACFNMYDKDWYVDIVDIVDIIDIVNMSTFQ